MMISEKHTQKVCLKFKHVDVCYSKLGQQFYVKCFIRLLTQDCILKRYDFLSMIRTFLESIAIFQQIIAI